MAAKVIDNGKQAIRGKGRTILDNSWIDRWSKRANDLINVKLGLSNGEADAFRCLDATM